MSNTKQIESITIRADILKRALKATLPAMSKDEARFHMNGVHVGFDGGDLLIESTDGHTAHRVRIQGLYVDGDRGIWHSLIIPAQSAKEILKALLTGGRKRLESSSVTITRSGASCGDQCVSFKAIDCRFPPMDAAVPDRDRLPGCCLVGVNPDHLARAAKAAADFRDGNASLAWAQGEELDPILMYMDDSMGNRLDLVIMPMRR